MKEIIVTIRHGKSTVEAVGYEGASCKDATQAIRDAMGRTTQDDNKPEFEQRDVRSVGQ